MLFGKYNRNVISSKDAGQKILAFYSAIGIEGLTLNSVEETSGLYQSIKLPKQVVPIYLTKVVKILLNH